jgi:CubicO group peptidase (beta-lactamase class C family)
MMMMWSPPLPLLLLIACYCCSDDARAASGGGGDDGLGPGNGPWQRAPPELHGLSGARLEAAAASLSRELPNRYCMAVARGGKLVFDSYDAEHERYPGQKNTPATRYEVDSAGKTMQAIMVGRGVTEGLYDLDTPLYKYGVQPQAYFGPNNQWWWNQTLRSVLAQTTGVGREPPFTSFTYDSDDYIAHASHLIETVTGKGSAAWATEAFAKPLGLPDLYFLDGNHTDIGGGQMMSCLDLLRVGQLLLNLGQWKNASTGEAFQLISKEYMEEVGKPQNPSFVRNYGLLTWLNTPPTQGMADCCNAAWCDSWAGPQSSGFLNHSMLGEGSPGDAAIAVGWLGRYFIVIPSRQLVVVSMGATWGSSLDCAEGNGYLEAFTAKTMWSLLSEALEIQPPSPSPGPVQPPPPPIVKCAAPVYPKSPVARAGATGSCQCFCPPDEGFGMCFPANSTEQCADLISHPSAATCSPVNVVRECPQNKPLLTAAEPHGGRATEGCSGTPTAAITYLSDGKCHQGSATLCSGLPGKPATCSYSATVAGDTVQFRGTFAGVDCSGAPLQPAGTVPLNNCLPESANVYIEFVMSGPKQVDEKVYLGPPPPPPGPCAPKICGDCSKVGCIAPPCPPDFGQDCRCEAGLTWNATAKSCQPLALLTCGELAIKAGAPWNKCSPDDDQSVDCISCRSERSCPADPASTDTDHCQCSVRQYSSCTFVPGTLCKAEDDLYLSPQPCNPAPLTSCEMAMYAKCGPVKANGKQVCLQCVTESQKSFREAGCEQSDLELFCATLA